MAAQLTKSEIPYNRDVLRWAREWRQRTVEEAARHVNTSADKISEWEEGASKPTVRQARLLAEFYERPFLEFFLPEPPDVTKPPSLIDYRLYSGQGPSDQSNVEHILRWAQEMRLNVLDLYDLLGEEPPSFPRELYATTSDDPERVAGVVRGASGFDQEEQTALGNSKRYLITGLVRRAVESLGVIVLRRSELSKHGVRGVCLYDEKVPVVVFGKEAPTAQAFTIVHELGHVVLQNGSISGPPTAISSSRRGFEQERWCNRFAAAFLMPREALAELWPAPSEPRAELSDEELDPIAAHFAVSPHAALIRLINLKYVQASYYWDKKRADFIEAESVPAKNYGRAAYYGTRYRSVVGDTYTGLVLEALHGGLMTHHSAAEFMGIKNPKHFSDIVENFRP